MAVKRIMAWTLCFATWLVIAASLELFGAEVKLAWDLPAAGTTWDGVRVYERAGLVYTKVQEVSGTVNQALLSGIYAGPHYYVVRAVKGVYESGNSNEVTVEIPVAPQNLKTVVTVTIN